MSGLEIAVSLSTVVYGLLRWYKEAVQFANSPRSALSRTYGRPVAVLIALLWPSLASEYERIDSSIFHGEAEHAMAFRQAITTECNMTAVAGAIIAQVAITALGLSSLSATHWIARACFLIAVTSGCLSVYYACAVGRIIGRLYKANLVRDWLMMTRPREHGILDSAEPQEETDGTSLAAIFIVSAPFNLVKVSIFSFMLGLAIYQGFVFSRNLDKDAAPHDSRNNFVLLMVGTGLCLLFFILSFSAKDIESSVRARNEFATQYLRTDLDRRFSGLIALRPLVDVVGTVRDIVREHQKPAPVVIRGSENIELTTTSMDNAESSTPRGPSRPNEPTSMGLVAALELAARAHTLCAEADRQVALEYSKLREQ